MPTSFMEIMQLPQSCQFLFIYNFFVLYEDSRVNKYKTIAKDVIVECFDTILSIISRAQSGGDLLKILAVIIRNPEGQENLHFLRNLDKIVQESLINPSNSSEAFDFLDSLAEYESHNDIQYMFDIFTFVIQFIDQHINEPEYRPLALQAWSAILCPTTAHDPEIASLLAEAFFQQAVALSSADEDYCLMIASVASFFNELEDLCEDDEAPEEVVSFIQLIAELIETDEEIFYGPMISSALKDVQSTASELIGEFQESPNVFFFFVSVLDLYEYADEAAQLLLEMEEKPATAFLFIKNVGVKAKDHILELATMLFEYFDTKPIQASEVLNNFTKNYRTILLPIFENIIEVMQCFNSFNERNPQIILFIARNLINSAINLLSVADSLTEEHFAPIDSTISSLLSDSIASEQIASFIHNYEIILSEMPNSTSAAFVEHFTALTTEIMENISRYFEEECLIETFSTFFVSALMSPVFENAQFVLEWATNALQKNQSDKIFFLLDNLIDFYPSEAIFDTLGQLFHSEDYDVMNLTARHYNAICSKRPSEFLEWFGMDLINEMLHGSTLNVILNALDVADTLSELIKDQAFASTLLQNIMNAATSDSYTLFCMSRIADIIMKVVPRIITFEDAASIVQANFGECEASNRLMGRHEDIKSSLKALKSSPIMLRINQNI